MRAAKFIERCHFFTATTFCDDLVLCSRNIIDGQKTMIVKRCVLLCYCSLMYCDFWIEGADAYGKYVSFFATQAKLVLNC